MAEYCSTKRNGRTIMVHRLVWIENKGEILEGYIIHHKDGNKKNNNIDNLECISRREHTIIHNKNQESEVHCYLSGR